MKTKLFVYGTLKRGGSNHGWMRGQTFLGEGRTQPDYRMFDLGGYPGLVRVEPGQGVAVTGEVWEVDEDGLRRLDVLEGVAEGEYELVPVAMDAPWAEAGVRFYHYLRQVQGRPDCGDCWR